MNAWLTARENQEAPLLVKIACKEEDSVFTLGVSKKSYMQQTV